MILLLSTILLGDPIFEAAAVADVTNVYKSRDMKKNFKNIANWNYCPLWKNCWVK